MGGADDRRRGNVRDGAPEGPVSGKSKLKVGNGPQHHLLGTRFEYFNGSLTCFILSKGIQ